MPAADVLRDRWKAPDSFSTTLLVMFLDRFGTAALKWDPNTILVEIEESFHVDLPSLNFDRLMAGIALLKSDAFYKDLPTFIDLCNILSGDAYDPRTWDPADSLEVAWGITETLLICPPEPDDDEPFSDEIRAYIGTVLDAEGIITPPGILRLAMREPSANHPEAYSDDPEMYAAIHAFEAEKTDGIQQLLLKGLQQLAHQLETLPLRTGDAREIVAGILNYAA